MTMPDLVETASETEEATVESLAGLFEEEINPKKRESPSNAKGGENEPKSGESEGEEPDDEAENETETDDEPEEAEEPDDTEQPPRFRFKANGADVEATLDELTQSYSREADYTRKTQTHAEDVRKWEATRDETLKADRAALTQEREQYKSVLGIWEKQLTQALGTNEDLEQLRRDNPGEWSARMTERYDLQGRLTTLKAEQERLAGEDRTKQESKLKRKISEEGKKMLEAIPEWKDQAAYVADSTKIFEYGKSAGITIAEISDAVSQDHRLARVLKDAAAFQALQAKKPATVKKVEAVKSLPPGNASPQLSKGSRLARATEALKRSGDINDLAQIFKLKGTG